MTYHTFDRQVLVKTETTEGTAISMTGTNYVDCQDDIDVQITPIANERPLVRPGLTPVPDLSASTGLADGTMIGTGTMTMTVEMAFKTGTSPQTTAPAWGPLMKACGFEEVTGIERIGISGWTSSPFFNRENLSVSAAVKGTALGTHFEDDSYLYYKPSGGGISTGNTVDGDVSSGELAATGTSTAAGIAYCLNTTKGTGNNSSCTIQLYRAGKLVTFKGCRGSVAFEFQATNRVLMTFTMEGVLSSVANGSRTAGIAIGHANPPTFDDATFSLAEHASTAPFTSALFESLSLDLGNQIVVRSDANSASGYKAAQIVGRAPTLSANPDSVVGGATSSSVFDFYEKWVEGLSLRAEWKVGAGMNGQSALFRIPAGLIDGVSPGDRDEVEVDDVSLKVTGGMYGDSVEPLTPTTRFYDDRGYDNEMTIILY